MASQSENTFFSDAGITVTQARFMVPGQTYAMSGVTSVATAKDSPSKKGPIIMIAIGLLALAAGKDALIFGFLLIAGGALWLYLQKPTFVVMLHSASGESRAFTSKDGDLVSRIVGAINEAIVARG